MFGPLLEPAKVLGTVRRVLRRYQRRSQPVDLLVVVVVGGDRAVALRLLDQRSLLDHAHDRALRRGVGDAVGATVAHHQQRLLAGVFGALVVQMDVVDETQ